MEYTFHNVGPGEITFVFPERGAEKNKENNTKDWLRAATLAIFCYTTVLLAILLAVALAPVH